MTAKENDDAKEGSQESIKITGRICPYQGHGCVSQNGRHCFWDSCQPIDDQGRRFRILAWIEGDTRMTTRIYTDDHNGRPLPADTVNAEIARVMAVIQVPAVVDPTHCNGCEALKMCSAIVPNGPWNPAPGNGVKACPGVQG